MKLKVEGLRLKVSKAMLWLVAIAFLSTINSQQATAQQTTASVSVILRADSTELNMGDPVQVSLTIKHPKGTQITFPAIGDTLGSMEVSSASGIDTSAIGNDITLLRTYTVAAYDSGTYHAGPVQVLYKSSTGSTDTAYSNVLYFAVATLDVDTTKPIMDIKPPLEVPYVWQEFAYHILGGALLLVLLIAAYFLYQFYKKNKPVVEERYKPKDAAHVWARKELKKLEEEQLWQKGEVKHYYSRLTEILRLYLEYRYGWMGIESTTEELEAEVGMYDINTVAKGLMFETLRTADLVKFAKMLPMPDVHTKALQNVRQFVEMTALIENDKDNKSNVR
jgi:hypothetical protein